MQGILFIDIETVPDKHPAISEAPKEFLKRFNREITEKQITGSDLLDYYYDKAGLFAEHNKVVSISMGVLKGDKFYVRAYSSKNEKELLAKLGEKIIEYKVIAGHNIKDFDCPILMRRFLINGLPVPSILDTMNKKPWEVPYYDTMVMWAGSQMNYRVSLDLLCTVLDIPSPKGEMDGSKVSDVYYSIFDKDNEGKEAEILNNIGSYCNGDNIAAARCYAKMRGFEVFDDAQVIILK